MSNFGFVQEVTTAQKQVENLQRERQDLLDMLGREGRDFPASFPC